MSVVKIEKNVQEFIIWASREVGKYEEDNFNVDIFMDIQGQEVDSPIEQLLWCALKFVIKLNNLEGVVGCEPQSVYDKFRMDFCLTCVINNKEKLLAVECDSQQWHERTERERRYEKRRDRILQSAGHDVFHYTGKEIIENPVEIAIEILSELTGRDKKDFIKDSNVED